MNFKEQVDKILENRKVQLKKVEGDESTIFKLRNQVENLKRTFDVISDKDVKQLLPRITDVSLKLENASRKITVVKERFQRATVNIGVAGAKRVGKSEFLQKLTGLTGEQIPTGSSGRPVTACRSHIFNQPAENPSYANIQFYSSVEFIKKRVFPEIDGLGFNILSLEDFQKADFSKRFDISEANYADKNKRLEKLSEMQEAFGAYRDFLSKPALTLNQNELSELRKYVTYSTPVEERFWPAVKNVNIYCHLQSLDGAAVQLIDLPGLGEVGAVDKIQTEGLEHEVDHGIEILRPNQSTSSVDKNYATMAETLRTIQQDVTNRKNLFSYAINIDKGKTEADGWADELISDLKKNDPNVTSENLYKICAVESDSVTQMFGKILERMIRALPEMDNDFLNAYKSQLEFEKIFEDLDGICKVIAEKTFTSDEITKIYDLASELRSDFSADYRELYGEIGKSSSQGFEEEVEKIYSDVRQKIEANLLYNGKKNSWKEYARAKAHKNTSADAELNVSSIYDEECQRLRNQVIEEYEKLDVFYTKSLDEFKESIIHIFRKKTGNFIDGNKHGSEAVKNVISKLNNRAEMKEVKNFILAFEWLDKLVLDFRQHVYPAILTSEVSEQLNPSKDDPLLNFTDIHSDDDRLEKLRAILEKKVTKFNFAIRREILLKDFTSVFMQCACSHFVDLLVRGEEEIAEKSFMSFVRQFKDSIFATSDKDEQIKLAELENNIQVALNMLKELDK